MDNQRERPQKKDGNIDPRRSIAARNQRTELYLRQLAVRKEHANNCE